MTTIGHGGVVDVSEHIIALRGLVQSIHEAREKDDWRMVSALAVLIGERANDCYLIARDKLKGE